MREGALYQRELPDGRELVVYPMLFNDRVCVGIPNEFFYERGFCFPKGEWRDAAEQWDGRGDPPGPWIKEAGTDRYGPGS